MPTIKALLQAQNASQPHLVRGLFEVLIERGAPDIFAMLGNRAFEGTKFQFRHEDTLASSSSVIDPRTTADLPEGVGTQKLIEVGVAAMGRNVDTAKIDIIGHSNINDQRYEDVMSAAKKFAKDYLVSLVQGMGWGNQFKGLDYWVDYYGGDQDYDLGGEALAKSHLNELLSRYKAEQVGVLFMDRQTTVEFRNILDAAPGATPQMFMDQRFGRPVLQYDGVPIITLDQAGAPKTLTGAALSDNGSLKTRITVANSDLAFPGFSKSDIGRTATVGANSSVIASVAADGTYADCTTNALGTTGTATVTLARKAVIYGVRFDETDGFTSIYHTNLGGQLLNWTMGEYYGPIAGMDVRDIGELQGTNIFRTRIDLYANFVSLKPDAIVRARNFTYAV